MNIDREVTQGDTARERLKFCLDQLTKAKKFVKGVDWGFEIVKNLTIEEIIGALVSAEQQLNKEEDEKSLT